MGTRNHQTSHQTLGKTRRSEKDFRVDIRGNSRGFEGVFGERNSRCCDLYRACQEEDGNCDGCGVRFEATRENFVWFWWIRVALDMALKVFNDLISKRKLFVNVFIM